jgi:hypothetical protein
VLHVVEQEKVALRAVGMPRGLERGGEGIDLAAKVRFRGTCVKCWPAPRLIVAKTKGLAGVAGLNPWI